MSNTSTHAPIYSFGTEKRDYQKEAEIMQRAAARAMVAAAREEGAARDAAAATPRRPAY